MISMIDAELLARELHARYEPMRAVVLVSRLLQKALFAGRSDEVIFWALVHAHYRGGDISEATKEGLAAFREFMLADPGDGE